MSARYDYEPLDEYEEPAPELSRNQQLDNDQQVIDNALQSTNGDAFDQSDYRDGMSSSALPPEPPTRMRRPIAKLDVERLLGEDGLPWVKANAKRVRLSGKGRDHQKLKKVLKFYELWAHQLYPRFNFDEFVMRTETLCHTRRMQMALNEWRNEEYGAAAAATASETDMAMDADVPTVEQDDTARAEDAWSAMLDEDNADEEGATTAQDHDAAQNMAHTAEEHTTEMDTPVTTPHRQRRLVQRQKWILPDEDEEGEAAANEARPSAVDDASDQDMKDPSLVSPTDTRTPHLPTQRV